MGSPFHCIFNLRLFQSSKEPCYIVWEIKDDKQLSAGNVQSCCSGGVILTWLVSECNQLPEYNACVIMNGILSLGLVFNNNDPEFVVHRFQEQLCFNANE